LGGRRRGFGDGRVGGFGLGHEGAGLAGWRREGSQLRLRHSRESGNPAKQTKCIETSNPASIFWRPGATAPSTLASDLLGRLAQHGFNQKYGIKLLVWFEQHATMESAITREKRIKKWNRAWKLELIEAANRDWRDLAEDFGFAPLS